MCGFAHLYLQELKIFLKRYFEVSLKKERLLIF